jgi:RHS repeat-associated protein
MNGLTKSQSRYKTEVLRGSPTWRASVNIPFAYAWLMKTRFLLVTISILLLSAPYTGSSAGCLGVGGRNWEWDCPVYFIVSGCDMPPFEMHWSPDCTGSFPDQGKVTWTVSQPHKFNYKVVDKGKVADGAGVRTTYYARFENDDDIGLVQGRITITASWKEVGTLIAKSVSCSITFTEDVSKCPQGRGVCAINAAPRPVPPQSVISLQEVSPDTINGTPAPNPFPAAAPQASPISGDIRVSALGVSLDVPLGRCLSGDSAGLLSMRESVPSKALCSPSCLSYDFQTNSDCTVIYYPDANTIKQVKVPEGFVNIVSNSAYKYTMQFYPTSSVVSFTNPLYALTGSPYATVTVENPDTSGSTSNRIRITAKDGKPYDYEYSTNGWKLTLANSLVKTINSQSWNSGVKTDRTEVRDAADNLLSFKIQKFQTNAWGRQLLESVVGIGAEASTNTCAYTLTTNGSLKTVIYSDGSWQISEHNAGGLTTNLYKSFGNQTATNSETLCHRIQYDYSTNVISGAGDHGLLEVSSPRRTIEKILGQEIKRTYFVYLPGEVREIRAITPGAAWNDASNLVTITRYGTNANRFAGRPISIERPDGTMDLLTYVENANGCITNTVWTGQPDGTKTSVVDGVKTVYAYGNVGQALSVISTDIVSGITTDSQIYSDFDDQVRPRKVTYLDGTFTWTDFGCCGPVTVTNRTGIVTQYLRDEAGRQTAVLESGITQTNILGADGASRISKRIGTDGSAHTLSQTKFDTSGRVVAVTNAASKVTTYEYGMTNGQSFTRTINPDGSNQTDRNYKDGRPDRTTGTAVRGVRYVYGVESESGVQRFYTKRIVLDESWNDTSEWSKTYEDMLGRNYKTLLSDANGSFSQQFFNTKGQLIKSVDPDGVATLYQYDETGALEYTALDQDRDTLIDFAGLDRVQREQKLVTAAHGYNVVQSKSYLWSTNGSSVSNLVSISEQSTDGLRTWQTSFGLTRSSVRTTPINASWTVTETEPDNTYSITLYATGRLSSVTRYDSNNVQIAKTTYGYDTHGRQHQTTDARNGTTTQIYNSADQLISVTTPAAGNGQGAQTTSVEYDNRGRVFKTTYPDSTIVTNEYFLTGERKKTFGSRTYPVEYTYDAQGRMLTMKTWKDFAGNTGTATTTWKYDGYRGFLTNKVYPDGIGPSYTYTAGGKLKTRKWARGVTTTYTTNSLGDIVSVDYSDSTPDITYTLDRLGRKTSISQGSDTTAFLFTDSGLPVSEKGTAGTLNGLTITNQYDSLMRRSVVKAMVTSPATTLSSATYGYDPSGRLQGVTNGTLSANYSYLGNSPMVSQILFRENTTTRMTTAKSYDYLNRLLSVSSTAGSSVISSHSYLYNDANQRTRVDLVDGSYWIYAYDKLGQVTSGKRYWADGTVVAGQQFDYAFDDIGNRSSTKAGGDANGLNQRSATYSANNLNQYTSRTVPAQVNVSGIADALSTVTVKGQATSRKGEYYWAEATANNASAADFLCITNLATTNSLSNTNIGYVFVPKTPEAFSYDADGNLTNDGRWVYIWDGENRLTQLESQTTAPSASKRKITYTYDYQSRLIARKSYTNNGSYQIKSDTKYLNDDWRCLAEINATNNNLIRGYVWGLDLSGSLEGAGGIGGLLMLTDSATGTSHFYAFDGNGNVSAMAKTSDSSKTAHYEYGPFGEVVRASGTIAKSNPIRFSTKSQDEETDLLYYGYRFYNASTGRWLSRDPIEEEGGVNIHALANNDPVDRVDSLGLWSDVSHYDAIERWLSDLSKSKYGGVNMAEFRWHCISLDIPKLMSEGNDRVDGTGSHANVSEFLNAQAEIKAHQHAMRRLGQSVSDARRMYNEFIRIKREDALIDAHQAKVEMRRGSKEKAHVFMTAALISIGMAQHPVADSTSPAHSGFKIWYGPMEKFPFLGISLSEYWVLHMLRETPAVFKSNGNLEKTVDAIREEVEHVLINVLEE